MSVSEDLTHIINKTKGEVLSYFQLVCPTESSFHSVRRKIHAQFDELTDNLSSYCENKPKGEGENGERKRA